MNPLFTIYVDPDIARNSPHLASPRTIIKEDPLTYSILAEDHLYNPERTSYPEAEHLRLGPSWCELVRYWSSPSQDEIDQHRGTAQFAVVEAEPDLLLLAYKFGSLDWSDTPFQAHRMRPDEQGVPVGDPGDELLLTTILVDADTGIIRAIHLSVLSPDVADTLRHAVRAQLNAPFDDTAAGRKLGAIYDRFATPQQMVEGIATAVCGPV